MINWIKKYKYKFLPFLAVILLGAAIVAYYAATDPIAKVSREEVEEGENTATHSEINPKGDESRTKDDNPFQHKGALEEEHVQNYIHWMSHQKVKAEAKWTHYRLTSERVEWLYKEVESSNFKYKDLYLDILTKWRNEDFSEADKDHNRIWSLQGGTVGKATAVLSEEEEEEYLQQYRRKLK